MDIIETKTGEEPLSTVKRAIDNVKPPLEVKSRRVGGATSGAVEVRPRRATTLAIRWVVDFSPRPPRSRCPSAWPVSCSTPPTVSARR